MAVFSNGSGISEIYVNGSKISSAYAYGTPVYSTKAGWQEAGTFTLTVTSANSNSVSGTITYKIYEYLRGATVIDRYYERSTISLSRLDEGCVTLNFGEGAVFYLGDENTSVEYFFPASGTITMSATELARVYRFKKHNALLNLGTSKTVTSNYIFQTQGMGITYSGGNLNLTTGWTISQTNRACRIANKLVSTYTVDVLNVPADGIWPVYAVSGAGTETDLTTITAAPNVYQTYANVRFLGLVTLYGGAITNFQNISQISMPTAPTITKSISDSTLTVGAGYAVDTDGMLVYVPTGTYSFADMVTAAADQHVPETLGPSKTLINTSDTTTGSAGTLLFFGSGSSYMNALKTTSQRAFVTMNGSHSALKTTLYEVFYSKYDGTTYSEPAIKTTVTPDTSSNAKSRKDVTFYMPLNSTLFNIRVTCTGTGGSGTRKKIVKYQYVTKEASTTPGTAQTRTLYAKISRNQDTGVVTYSATQTTGPTSTPYVSYILLGTLTVARNATTGSLA